MDRESKKLLSLIERPNFLGLNDEYFEYFNDEINLILKSVIGKPLEAVCFNLFHYTDDWDIRERDLAYREMQNKELLKLITCLKTGNYEAAQKISFLQDSGEL